MNIALWIAQGLLVIIYLETGFMKVFQTSKYKQQMKWTEKRKNGLLLFVGVAELAGGLGIVLPMLTGILPWLTPIAAVGLALVQLLAIVTVHLPDKDYKVIPFNLVLMALAIFVAVGRWGLFVK